MPGGIVGGHVGSYMKDWASIRSVVVI